jgi:hypothetical protein
MSSSSMPIVYDGPLKRCSIVRASVPGATGG